VPATPKVQSVFLPVDPTPSARQESSGHSKVSGKFLGVSLPSEKTFVFRRASTYFYAPSLGTDIIETGDRN